MVSKKAKLLAITLPAAAVIAMCLFMMAERIVSFRKEQISQANCAAVASEVYNVKLGIESRELEEASYYDKIKENMPERTERMLEEYNNDLLTLVNPWNPIDEDSSPELITVEDGFRVDRRCAAALSEMLFDCREAGNFPIICSAYRTQEYQQALFDNKIKRVKATGVSSDGAPAIAAKSVAVPGTSEHQLGLAVDLIDYYYTNLDEGQERTGTQKWLMEHCADYGFILRYPNGSSEITGIIYEPWHYRYVGKSVAREITDSGITFEEYLQTREENEIKY